MKKILLIIVASMIVLTGCGSNNNNKNIKSDVNENIEEKVKDEIVTYPKDLSEELGEGTIVVSLPNENSKENLIPIIHPEVGVKIMQLDLSTSNFDNKKTSYIFIDKNLVAKGNYANDKVSLNLSDENLYEGEHVVEIIQFKDNDSSKEPITYKSAKYEVKMK